MTQLIVISAIGTDRTGVVQDLTKVILGCGGNIEQSRMTTLGSEFAMLLFLRNGSSGWTVTGNEFRGQIQSSDIEIADVLTSSYAAAHTGAPMYSVQMTVNVPSSQYVAQLRNEFYDLCDELNLDGVIEAVTN